MKQTYADRNATLRHLGFSCYTEYLASPLWASIKRRAMARSDRCQFCDKPATCVHHRGYGRAVLLGETLTPLIPLCSGCHYKVEHDSQGRKYKLHESQSAFTRLWIRSPVRQAWNKARKAEPSKRTHLRGYCCKCGQKAKKGNRTCRPCARPS